MALSIFDLIAPREATLYYETLLSNRVPYLGEGLFPNEKRRSLRLEWIKGYEQPIRVLQPSAFDAKPLLRERPTLSTVATKMPFFREAARMGEEDRQQILMFQSLNAGNTTYANELIDRYFMDTTGIIESAYVNAELMRMQLMTNGATEIASVPESGQAVVYSYNYDPNGDWAAANNVTLTGTAVWSDHVNSNPMQDILDVKERARRQNGTILTRMIVGFETFMDIVYNERLKLAMNMNVTAAANAFITPEQARSAFTAITGVSIAVYDKFYVDPAPGTEQHYFYPERGCATLLPAGTLGKTAWGTTPEEADLLGNVRSPAQVALTGPGIAVSTEIEALPVNSMFWVSSICLPSFENMDRVYNIKYTPAP